MTTLVERKTSRAGPWSRRIAWFSLVLLVVAVASHRFELIDTPPMLWVLVIVAALALVALLLAMFGLLRLWQVGAVGGAAAASGLLLALVVLAPFGFGLFRYAVYPKLNDISTDLTNPPHFVAARRLRDATMNPLTSITPRAALIQSDFYTALTGRRYALSAEHVMAAIQSLLDTRGWRIERPLGDQLDSGEATIETLARLTPIAVESDVAVRLTNEGDTVYVDLRAASRYGDHDLGVNAAAIDDFLRDLDDEVVKRALTAPPDIDED